jgi:hypothetical protein
VNWEKFLQFNASYPRRRGRNLCKYLSDESDRDGLRVYADFSLKAFYKGVIKYFQQTDPNKIRLVWLDDIGDPQKQSHYFLKAIDWLYPGGHTFKSPDMSSSAVGHDTDHDPVIRNRLSVMVESLDREFFNNTLASIDAAMMLHQSL